MSIMSIATETAPGGYGINGNEHEGTTLTIYGQTLDDDTAGHLNINSDNDCIYIDGDYAQHGGNVTANSTYWSGIALWNNLTLTGGTLYVTSSKKAIITYYENVDILGGKFSAIGGDKGIYTMEGDVTLGWKNADDEITISSLAYGAPRCTMKIVDGQAFTDSVKNIYDSTTPSNTLWALHISGGFDRGCGQSWRDCSSLVTTVCTISVSLKVHPSFASIFLKKLTLWLGS